MQRFLQIIKHTQVNKTFLVLALGYMVFMTAVVMTTPTNASFTNQIILKGQMVMGTEVTESDDKSGEGGDDKQDSDDSEEELKQENDEATDKRRSSDDQNEEASESDDETEEASEADDETETAPDESE